MPGVYIAVQLSEFVSRRSPRRHYVRFGRASAAGGSNGRRYTRFGRDDTEDIASSSKRGTRHYVRFGRDEPLHEQSGSDADKRAHYVRFGRADAGDSDDRLNEADKRPNYVRFG